MKRFTTDTPDGNIANALNLFYIKDKETWVRGYGPAPDHGDISLDSFIKNLCKTYSADINTEQDFEEFSCEMAEQLFCGPEDIEGLLAVLYTAGRAFAELRHKLMEYEDTGFTPRQLREIDPTSNCARVLAEAEEDCEEVPIFRLSQLAKAEREGKAVILPFKPGDMVYITGHKFPCEIKKVCISSDTIVTEWVCYDSGRESIIDEGEFSLAEIGKTVFAPEKRLVYIETHSNDSWGSCVSVIFGQDQNSAKLDYSEFVARRDAKEILKSMGYDHISDESNVRFITPEEFESKYMGGSYDDMEDYLNA